MFYVALFISALKNQINEVVLTIILILQIRKLRLKG